MKSISLLLLFIFGTIDQTDKDNTEFSTDHRSHPLTHSRTCPVLCLICTEPKINSDSTSPISETQSCTNLSGGDDSDNEANFHSMPNHLKVGYCDAMILYAEADREEATAFLNHLRNDIRLENGETIKAVLYDGPELLGLSGLKLEQLDKAFGRCSYTFVYLTKNLVNDVWCKISQESMLMRTVYDQDEKWRVVPVYTMRRIDYDFKIPFGINALNGIRYYDPDEFYRKGVASLIEKTVPERIRKERRIEQKRRDWEEIHGPCHTDLSQERSPTDVSNDDLLKMDRLTMVQPQQSK